VKSQTATSKEDTNILVESTFQQQQSLFDKLSKKTILFATSTLAALFFPLFIHPDVALADSEDKFVNALSALVNAKKILAPVKSYVELQGYDNARTNIYYIVNNLSLQKKADALVQSSIDVVDDESKIDLAQESASRIANTASQLDSSVYTVIFIPSEDGSVNPTQQKYITQAYKYYDDFNKDLDDLIQIADGNELLRKRAFAQAENEVAEMPKILFKQSVKKSGISGSGF
jgi:hypothetical protein